MCSTCTTPRSGVGLNGTLCSAGSKRSKAAEAILSPRRSGRESHFTKAKSVGGAEQILPTAKSELPNTGRDFGRRCALTTLKLKLFLLDRA